MIRKKLETMEKRKNERKKDLGNNSRRKKRKRN